MIDEDGLRSLRSSLEADGYRIEVRSGGGDGRVDVRISATPEACADCLVPKPILRGILAQVLAVPEQSIDLAYPPETGTETETGAGGGHAEGRAW